MRVGRDHRPDVLEREPDRPGLERRQPRRCTERVAPQLLVDVDRALSQLRVDRVTAAAEVDEVEQRQVLLELVRGDGGEALEQLGRRDLGLPLLAARREQVGEQRLQDTEPLRRHGTGRALDGAVALHQRRLARGARGFALVPLTHAAQRGPDFLLQLVRLERHGATVLAQHPRGELGDGRVLGDEDVVLERPCRAVCPAHPPGGVAANLDPRGAGGVADLPRRPAAVDVDVEVGRGAEVPLAPSGELDVAADPGDAEGADVLAVEVLPDDVPEPVVVEQRVRVERPLAHLVAGDRPVLEAHRPLLRDRVLELRQPARRLRRVVRVEHLDATRRLGRRLAEAGASEGEVLEREAERLGVGELPLEEVEGGLQRRQLLVLELELGEEVLLRAERVQLLAGELVALRLERDAEREQLRAVGVEAARESLVGHLRIALDVRLHVAGGDRPALRHQEGD